MTGDLPPSSSVTRFRLPLAARMIDLPTSVEPVNEILSTSGMLGKRRAGLALAGDDVDDALGEAGLEHQLAQPSAESGVCSAGFSTAVQPAASAGATFETAIMSGKFHGTIRPATPTGSRTV